MTTSEVSKNISKVHKDKTKQPQCTVWVGGMVARNVEFLFLPETPTVKYTPPIAYYKSSTGSKYL